MEQKAGSDVATLRFEAKSSIPPCIPIIVGDCLQNLRSSLDYLVWELVIAAQGDPGEKSEFPICGTPKGFKDAIGRGFLSNVPPAAITEIEALQPYHHGQHWEKDVLWVLNKLTNINKHRRILLTLLKGGFLYGTAQTVTIAGETFAHLDPGSAKKDTEISLPVGMEKEVKMDTQAVAFIAFDERVAKGLEVSTVLNGITQCMIEEVFPAFDGFLG
jgi:hypothetical protein